MATRTVNIAAENVLLRQDETADYESRLNRYRTSLSVFRSMADGGTLTESDYGKICDILADKYGISLCSIFRR